MSEAFKSFVFVTLILFPGLSFSQIGFNGGFAKVAESDFPLKVLSRSDEGKEIELEVKPGELFYYSIYRGKISIFSENGVYGETQIEENRDLISFEEVGTSPVRGNRFVFDNGEVKISAMLINFDPKNHKLEYGAVPDEKYLLRIDDAEFFGTDGRLPRTQLKNLSISIDGRELVIPEQGYSDLFQAHEFQFFKGFNDDIQILTVLGGDGASGYRVALVFVGGKFVRKFDLSPAGF